MQTWHPRLLDMEVEALILLPPYPDLLTDPVRKNHPLIETKQLMLAACDVFGIRSSQDDMSAIFVQSLVLMTQSAYKARLEQVD